MSEIFALPSSVRLVTFIATMLVSAALLFCAVYGALGRRKPLHVAYVSSLFASMLVMTVTRTPLLENTNLTAATYVNLILLLPIALAIFILIREKRYYILIADIVWCIINLPFLTVIPHFAYVQTASIVYIIIRAVLIAKITLDSLSLYPGRLAIKDSLDRTADGIAFVNIFGRITYLNTVIKWALADMEISSYTRAKNIVDRIKSYAANDGRKVSDYSYIVNLNGKSYRFAFDHPISQITCVDVTEEEALVKETEHNKLLLENANDDLSTALSAIESIQKSRELVSVKGHIHDDLAQRLSILHMFILNDTSGNLRQMKDMLSTLEITSTPQQAPNLDDLISVLASIGVNLNVNGEIPKDESIRTIIYKLAKEASTNAIKHAKSQAINVNITRDDQNLVIAATNGGIMPSSISFGNGLNTLKNEAESLGGTLEASITAGQFHLVLTLPQTQA